MNCFKSMVEAQRNKELAECLGEVASPGEEIVVLQIRQLGWANFHQNN